MTPLVGRPPLSPLTPGYPSYVTQRTASWAKPAATLDTTLPSIANTPESTTTDAPLDQTSDPWYDPKETPATPAANSIATDHQDSSLLLDT